MNGSTFIKLHGIRKNVDEALSRLDDAVLAYELLPDELKERLDCGALADAFSVLKSAKAVLEVKAAAAVAKEGVKEIER